MCHIHTDKRARTHMRVHSAHKQTNTYRNRKPRFAKPDPRIQPHSVNANDRFVFIRRTYCGLIWLPFISLAPSTHYVSFRSTNICRKKPTISFVISKHDHLTDIMVQRIYRDFKYEWECARRPCSTYILTNRVHGVAVVHNAKDLTVFSGGS